MPGITRQKHTEIQAAAALLIAAAAALLPHLTPEAKRSILVGLYKQLAADQGISGQAARRHIYSRLHPDRKPPNGWGGRR